MKTKKNNKNIVIDDIWKKLKIYNEDEINDRSKADNSFLDVTNDMFTKLLNNLSFVEAYNKLKTNNKSYDKLIFLRLLSIEFESINKDVYKGESNNRDFYSNNLTEFITFLFNDIMEFKKELDIDDSSIYSYFYEIENKINGYEDLEKLYSINVSSELNKIVNEMEADDGKGFFLPLIFGKVFNDIKQNNFELIRSFLNKYSSSWKISENAKCLLLMIAFVFYYYAKYNISYNGTDTLQKNILKFIDEKNAYLGSIQFSFRDFIVKTLENFDFSYITFSNYIMKIKNACEIRSFYSDSNGNLSELNELVLFWYLDFMLASKSDTYDALINLEKLENQINKPVIAKKIRDKYFKMDSNQLIDNFGSDFVNFFINDDSIYEDFKNNRKDIFFNFINRNYKREIITSFKSFDDKFDDEFLEQLNNDVTNCFKKYFGFRSILKKSQINFSEFESLEDYLLLQDSNINSLVMQNESEQSTKIFKHVIVDNIERSVKIKLEKMVEPVLIQRKTEEFDAKITNIIDNGPIVFVEENCKYLQYEILNQDLANQFIDECKEAVELPNYKTFFPPRTLILKDGFAFDMHINITYNKHYPTAKAIDNEIEKYFKDNKYIYESCFLERDELVQILKIKLRKYHVDYKFNFETNKDKIFIFRYR